MFISPRKVLVVTHTHTHTHTHSESLLLITYRRQLWLQERSSMLRLYVRVHFLSCWNIKY